MSIVRNLTSIGSVNVGGSPWAATYDAGNDLVYVSNAGFVSVLSGDRVVATVNVSAGPGTLAYDATNGFIYDAGGVLAIINGTTAIAAPAVGNFPQQPVVDPRTGLVYVPNYRSDNFSILNGTRVVGTFAPPNSSINNAATGAIFDNATGLVYTTSSGAGGWFDALNGTSAVGSTKTGNWSQPGAFDSANGNLYVPDDWGSGIAILNGLTSLAYLQLSSQWMFGAMFDPSNGYVLILESHPAQTQVIEGTTLIGGNVPLSGAATAATYDTLDRCVYFSGYGTNMTAFCNTPATPEYSVNFTEMGLPPGTNWSVTLGGVTNSSTTSTISFREPNGTGYPFTIRNVSGFRPSNPLGAINVVGAPVVIGIHFDLVQNLLFSETGLPSNTNWTVIIDSCGSLVMNAGPLLANYSTNATIGFVAPPGFSGCAYASAPAVPYLAAYSGDVAYSDIGGAPSFYVHILASGSQDMITVGFFLIPPPTIQRFYVSPGIVSLGGTVSFHANILGYGPLNVSYANLPPVIKRWNSTTFTCRPPTAGTFTVTLELTDRYGRSAQSNATFTVTTTGTPPGKSWSQTILGLPAWEVFSGLVGIGGSLLALGIGVTILKKRRRERLEGNRT